MTSISGHRPNLPLATQSSPPRLAAGQRIEAIVLGPTRQGVSVRIGQKDFQLDVPPRLANAGTLVLEGRSWSATSQQVQIVAIDDGLLDKPILADLRSRPEPTSSAKSAIVEKGMIKVTAQPLASDGKSVGPGVTLHLNAGQSELAGKAKAERPFVAGPAVSASMTDVKTEMPKVPDRMAGTGPLQQLQAEIKGDGVGADRIRDRGSTGAPSHLISTAGGGASGHGRVQTMASTSGVPSAVPPAATKNLAGVSMIGRPSEGRGSAASAIPAEGAGSPSNKAVAASAVTAYRSEAELHTVRDPKIPLETSRPITARTGGDHNRPMMATVVDRTDAGKVVLQVEGRYYRVEQPIDLPSGASLQVTLASSLPGLWPLSDQGTLKNAGTSLSKLIEILDEIDRAGRQATEAGEPNRERQLPLADRRLASRFLVLLNAEHGMPSPGGQASSSPEQADLALVQRERIQILVRELGTLASEPLAEGWKSMTLPLGSDQAHAVSFFFREQIFDPDDESADDQAEPAETQRAVFDVSFSQLGRCQIDALCQERRFDLMIRSEHPLSEEARQNVAVLFSSACEITGMSGEIGFKVGGFVEPARSAAASRDLQT